MVWLPEFHDAFDVVHVMPVIVFPLQLVAVARIVIDDWPDTVDGDSMIVDKFIALTQSAVRGNASNPILLL
jgi:hypothetical protein